MKIFGWGCGISFILIAPLQLQFNVFWALISLSGGIICLPPVWSILFRTLKITRFGRVFLLGVTIFLIGTVANTFILSKRETSKTAPDNTSQISEEVQNVSLSIYYHFDGDKLVFSGLTNLPSGTKIGTNLIKNDTSSGAQNNLIYSAQDYDIYVNEYGSFEGGGFTDNGKKLTGKLNLRVFVVNNKFWQTLEIQEQLKNYALIDDADGIVPASRFSQTFVINLENGGQS